MDKRQGEVGKLRKTGREMGRKGKSEVLTGMEGKEEGEKTEKRY